MKRRAVIERGIGETRAAVYEGRRLVELHLDRWSLRALPKKGERWTGQVVTVDNSVAGAFVHLGAGPDSLLPFKAQGDLPRLTDGMKIDVTITKEAVADKGPLVRYAGPASLVSPGRVTALSLEDRLTERFPGIAFEEAPVSVIDDATERVVAVPGGGSIAIEQTQALIAIDVDKGGAERVAELCQSAAMSIMAQLRLRGLGGLIVIDFPNMRKPKQRSAVLRRLETLGDADPASVRVAPFSRFGVVEMTRGQDGPSLDALRLDRFGEPTVETRALGALRRLQREGRANPGAKLTLSLPEAEWNWLETAPFDWREAMTDNLGARFEAVRGDTLDVKADR